MITYPNFSSARLKHIFFISLLFIGLCSISRLTLALDLNISDERLRSCIEQTAAKNHWQSTADITKLECHNQAISSLEGINQLINLENLSLYNNALSDIPTLLLPKLTQLNIAKNKLTRLQLSALPALETIYAFGNQLQTLELKQLPALKILKANNNQITHFIYADLPALEKLYLFDNKMVTIDIYRLPKMNYMDVRQNPMPDKLYEDMDKLKGVTFLHNGNTRDWHQ